MKILEMGKPGTRSVEFVSQLLKRFYYMEREWMRTLAGYYVNISDWEIKKMLPLHIWQSSKRADALRTRVLEMRYPKRDVDGQYDTELTAFMKCLIRSRNDAELLEGVYFVTAETLLKAYNKYLQEADPVEDAPTIAFMKHFVGELTESIQHAKSLYNSRIGTFTEPSLWMTGLTKGLESIHWMLDLAEKPIDCQENGKHPEVIQAMQRTEFTISKVPVRDPRFPEAKYYSPGIESHGFIENQISQGITHVNEIWAAEITALVLWTWDDMPWDFYTDCARWCYDEARHSLMGEERLAKLGLYPGVHYPVWVSEYMANIDSGELHVLAELHRREKNGPAWKQVLKEQFEQQGDTTSAQDFDYDWADESIHLQYGHKWILHRLKGDMEAMEDLLDETEQRTNAYCEQIYSTWDYEPYLTNLQNRIAELKAGLA